MAQDTELRCSKPSVIPLSYPGAPIQSPTNVIKSSSRVERFSDQPLFLTKIKNKEKYLFDTQNEHLPKKDGDIRLKNARALDYSSFRYQYGTLSYVENLPQ